MLSCPVNCLLEEAYKFYNLASLNRFSTTKTIKSENVSTHIYFTMLFARLLHKYYVFDLNKVLSYLFYHDLHESIIGDILNSAKLYDDSFSECAKSLDYKASQALDGVFMDDISSKVKSFNNLDCDEAKIANVCDKLAATLFIYNERKLGNTLLEHKFNQYINWINSYDLNLKQKNHLWVIEGFDRTGKDYLLEQLNNAAVSVPSEADYTVFIQNNDAPPYRDTDSFLPWLKSLLNKQADMLINLDTNVVMSRLFLSDGVYSELFGRPCVADSIFDRIKEHYTVHQIVLLYNDYQTYLDRCNVLNCEVEYSEDEFYELDNLYRNSKYTRIFDTQFITIHDGGNFDSGIFDLVYGRLKNHG